MKPRVLALIFATTMAVTATPAFASSFAGTSAGSASEGSSDSSSSSSGDDKLVEQAREDAAGFVASEGEIRSARLEAAFRVLRKGDASAEQASDLALAKAILARPAHP